MKKTRRIFITRSSDYLGGGFGFTLRHFVIYPPSVSVNDILQASYSVVIDEHQQKLLDEEEGETISRRFPSMIASSSSDTHIHHQGEQQQQQFLSSNSKKIIVGDDIEDDGTSIRNERNFQSFDTILVKEVRLDSPAYRSGLRQGDRILSVNEQSIHGESYSQVIALIQNTPTDLILNVIPKDEDTISLTSNQSSLPLNRSSSSRPSLPIMSKNTIEQKLRSLQLNLAHGRTQEELAQAGVYFPSPSPPPPPSAINSSSSSQNIFSNYIDSVHKALDSSKQLPKDNSRSYYHSPYHNEYIPYDYKQMNSSFLPIQDPSMSDELKSPSNDSLANDNDMKTEFVNFRKKQFESGHVENILRDSQRDSKTKKYSEKMKYENEWTHLTAVTDLESVMERASHFEDIDPDKFARLKSKHLNSPPLATEEIATFQEDFIPDCNAVTNFYDTHLIKPTFASSASSFSFPRANELNDMEYSYDPRYTIESVRRNQTPTNSYTHYAPLTSNPSPRNPYSTNSSSRTTSGVSLIRQDSYITAVRANHPTEQTEFVNMHAYTHLDFPFNPETPILRRKVSQYGQSERRTSYLLATDQRVANRGSYIPSDFGRTNPTEDYSYDQQQKIRSTPQHQIQAIKKLKNFFGEATPEVAHALDQRSSFSPPTKSISYFDSTLINTRESIPLTTLVDHLEASKEGILYCKTVLKDGRRAADRSWRGAWAVLRRGALFLGKEKKHGLLIPLSCDSFPINLRNAEVELASDYIKKPRVFKLTTSNQSEFLFQAPDLQSLTEWLDVINEHCLSSHDINEKENSQRQSTSSLPPNTISQQDLISSNEDQQQKFIPSDGIKSKPSARSPSLKRSPSLRFRKSQKSSITQPTSSLNALNSPSNVSPRRSFVKSIVKKGLRTLKSSSSILTSQMSGQIYDESSGESLSSTTGGPNALAQGVNFSIELEECEASSISRSIPIVVEILTRLVELRGINYQGIYRHAGGLTAVNWLVNELDKGAERIELNSEKWYDIKAVASTLKTFFAKLPDSLLSSKMSSLCVESSRIENHCHRLVELKRLVTQLDEFRFETLKYLCAHFRRVVSKCDINKIDARNLAIIFGPTLIWDSKASLQANLVDNPEKIRIIESFILYYEWFFTHNKYDELPVEINPQIPKLQSLLTLHSLDYEGISLNNETKPSEIIQQIVRAAKRRWSSPLLLDSLSSLSTTTTTTTDQQQPSKAINISVKRTRRREKKEEKSSRSRSVDSSINGKLVSSSTDSAVYSMSDASSSIVKKPSQSMKDISHFFQYFSLRNDKSKSKTLTNMRRKKSRKKISSETFLPPVQKADEEEMYEQISNSSIGFMDESPAHHQCALVQQTSLLKSKLIQHENILNALKQQINQVDQQLLIIQEDSMKSSETIDHSRVQLIKRRHTLNSLFDLNCLFLEKEKHSSSSLYALQLL